MNKNIQIVLNIVFALAIAFLIYQQQSADKTQEGVDTAINNVADSLSTPKSIQLRYVNSDSIWSKYKYVDELRNNLKKKQAEYQSNLEQKFKAFEKEVGDFRQAAATMSQAEGEQKQKDLMAKEQRLTELQQDLSSQLMDMEDQMKLTLRDSILSYLKNHHGNNADVILDYSTSSSVLMVDDSLNLTSSVLKGLNDEYQDRNKKKK